jgi:hypothetical protein
VPGENLEDLSMIASLPFSSSHPTIPGESHGLTLAERPGQAYRSGTYP